LTGGNNIPASEESKFKKLKNFNLAMGFLHLFQGILMLVIAESRNLGVWTTFQRMEGNNIIYVRDEIGTLPLVPMISMFLFVSAIAHFSLSTYGNRWYVDNLKKGMNPARWLEYSISSSIMIVVIAVLVGITELGTLILIFTLNATMNLFGWMMELHNQTTQKTDWTAYLFGCIAGFVPWLVLGIYFFGAVLENGGNVPTFVYAIFFVLAAFFNVFALNMVMQYRGKGRWADYLYGEKVYIILSLTAKSTLAWLVFGGTYRF
jgi:hypothetical protein